MYSQVVLDVLWQSVAAFLCCLLAPRALTSVQRVHTVCDSSVTLLKWLCSLMHDCISQIAITSNYSASSLAQKQNRKLDSRSIAQLLMIYKHSKPNNRCVSSSSREKVHWIWFYFFFKNLDFNGPIFGLLDFNHSVEMHTKYPKERWIDWT